MTDNGLGQLAEAQRETVRALAALTEQFREQADKPTAEQAGGQTAEEPGNRTGGEAQKETGIVEALGELSKATAANTEALGGFRGELGGLLAGLAGGLKDGGGLLGGILKSGFGLASLGLQIAGLFGGGSGEQPAPLTRFVEPARLALEVANTENILEGFPRADRDQRGQVRAEQPVLVQPQVTVNVSAMDSRSFLDHSEQIAQAVREAMLYMHPVNDLISEL
ncbi:MAG: hypothetical protein HY238_04345 [Acidobacteria bacterium]|nr:hypothetical protein [Acidobacteriota bacterium]